MGKVIERLCRCDAERASYLLRSLKAWAAYLGILCLGGMIFGAPLYVWFDRPLTAADAAHQAEIGRMQAINQDLSARAAQAAARAGLSEQATTRAWDVLKACTDEYAALARDADAAIDGLREGDAWAKAAAKVKP